MYMYFVADMLRKWQKDHAADQIWIGANDLEREGRFVWANSKKSVIYYLYCFIHLNSGFYHALSVWALAIAELGRTQATSIIKYVVIVNIIY